MKLRRVLIVSSPTSEKHKTQISLVYLATVLNKLGIGFDILDLSGKIDYFDPSEGFFSQCDSDYWLSPQIFYNAFWLDEYLPKGHCDQFDAVFYSALFSPDILVHGRHSVNQQKCRTDHLSIIGGAAISSLNNTQLSVISEIFDYVCVGQNIEYLISHIVKRIESTAPRSTRNVVRVNGPARIQPDYELMRMDDFVTVYSGYGCNWGRCRFCNSASLCNDDYYFRPVTEIAEDFSKIFNINPGIKDVMLSSDSFTQNDVTELVSYLRQQELAIPYNIMLRGEKWVSEQIGESLLASGCTDVFIGAESLDDGILKIINKGLNTKQLINAVQNLSPYVKVTVGLLLFIPTVTEKQLDSQLRTLGRVLPHIAEIEPEILSVVQGSQFAEKPEEYGIELWARERTVNDSWCYGLSPDIPWTFRNRKSADIWFRYYDRLKNLVKDLVKPHYWEAIDYMRSRF